MLIENRWAKWITKDNGCPMTIRRLPLASIIIILSSVLVSGIFLGRPAAPAAIPLTESTTTPVNISLEEARYNGKPTPTEFGSDTRVFGRIMKILLSGLAVIRGFTAGQRRVVYSGALLLAFA